MAIYRSVQISFWSDTKVEEEFTPEDKYFYLYLFTNPHTNLCGCYKLGKVQAANQMGYSKESIEKLLDRFQNVHDVIDYCSDTNEVYLKNWNKYNWTSSSKFLSSLRKEIVEIKNDSFREILGKQFDAILSDALAKAKEKELERLQNIPYIYGMDTTVTVTDTVSDTDKDDKNNIYKNIIDHLNTKTGKDFKYKTQSTKKHINARLEEGFTEDDFYKVIDYKCLQWKNDDKMKDYLRPETLFSTKFEGYLQSIPRVSNTMTNNTMLIEEEPELTDEEWLKMMQESDD